MLGGVDESLIQPDSRRRPVLPEQLVGAGYLAPLQRLLDDLHSKPTHGNLRVGDGHILVLHLLAFFNPVVRSLRMLEDLSQTPAAVKLMGAVERMPKSTLCDAHGRLDADVLLPVMRELMALLPRDLRLDGDLAGIQQQILAGDSTYFQTLANLAWALQNRKSNGRPGARARLYVQLDVTTGVPFGAGDGAGVELGDHTQSESKLASGHIVPGAIHLYDRGFVSFELLKAVLKADAAFVLRLTTQTHFTAVEDRPLSDVDRAAGILGDRVGYLTGSDKSDPPGQLLREVIAVNDADPLKPMRLLTSLLDLNAWQITALYRKRWQIELFFRWLKIHGQYTHLLSGNKDGAAWTFYVAVIGVTLLALHNGRRPSKYDLAMLSVVAAGGATLDDILPILKRRHRERELARIRDAKRRRSHVKSV
jgi:Transposase DDE domain